MAFIEPVSDNMARIKVVGVGGAGQNAVSSMVEHKRIEGVEFIAINTDLQALNASNAHVRIQIGPERTHGLGSGSDPAVGFDSAQESIEEIKAHLQGADMVFIAAGMGGGTGTGGSSVVAQVAREIGALTVGVVTKPFPFEGKRRMNQAEQGIRQLQDKVDALIVIPDEKLLSIVDDTVPLTEAFLIADEVVGNAVEGISELITSTGLVNVDFADVKAIMTSAGSALMGVGFADGESRAEKAARAAIESPLLEVDIKGSTGVLINIVGDSGLTMHEVNTAATIISDAAHDGANIIFGANIDPSVEGIKVTVIATGFDTEFSTVTLPDVSGVSDEEVFSQIDARFDQQSSQNQNQNQSDDDDFSAISVDVDHHDTDRFDDGESFDIEKMRQEVQKLEEAEKEQKDDGNDEKPESLSKTNGNGIKIASSSDKSTSDKSSSDQSSDQSDDDKKDDNGDDNDRSKAFWEFIKARS